MECLRSASVRYNLKRQNCVLLRLRIVQNHHRAHKTLDIAQPTRADRTNVLLQHSYTRSPGRPQVYPLAGPRIRSGDQVH